MKMVSERVVGYDSSEKDHSRGLRGTDRVDMAIGDGSAHFSRYLNEE